MYDCRRMDPSSWSRCCSDSNLSINIGVDPNTLPFNCRRINPSYKPRCCPYTNPSTNIGIDSSQQWAYNPGVVTNIDLNIVSDSYPSLNTVSNLYDHLLLIQISCLFNIIVDHHHCHHYQLIGNFVWIVIICFGFKTL